MEKPTVLIDSDGVKLQFLGAALPVVERITGKKFSPEDFEDWDIFATIGREHEDECYAAFKEPGFCKSIMPYPGAVEGVARLHEIADVYVVTSPTHGPHWYWERAESLYQYFGIPYKNVIHASKKDLIWGHVFVDDKPAHVRSWSKRWVKEPGTLRPGDTQSFALLWDQPYNRKEQGLTRVSTWNEVIEYVKMYSWL